MEVHSKDIDRLRGAVASPLDADLLKPGLAGICRRLGSSYPDLTGAYIAQLETAVGWHESCATALRGARSIAAGVPEPEPLPDQPPPPEPEPLPDQPPPPEPSYEVMRPTEALPDPRS